MNTESRPRLSVVIPAYNEESRLLDTIERVDSFLADQPFKSELIVVNDGSTDRTREIAEEFASTRSAYLCLNMAHRGKAAAVKAGVLAAGGDNVIFTDADLSTPIRSTLELLDALTSGADVAIGTREGAGARRSGEPAYRHLMGRVFNRIVQVIAVPGIDDTQCGFKGFRREVARDLFTRVRLYTSDEPVRGPRVTAFDVEILFLARFRDYVIVEIPVEWVHVSGSKVSPIADSLRMLGDLAQVRLNALLGRYNHSVTASQRQDRLG